MEKKQNKHFYSHLVDTKSIYVSLYILDLTEDEKAELMLIVESSIHHVVIDTVLSELSESDKRIFITHLSADKHKEIWNLLNKKTKNIDKKIVAAVDKLKGELRNDIRELNKT